MCYAPITLTRIGESVPCGRCKECKARRVSAWSFRLMQESRVSDSSYFITLTYDYEHVCIKKSGQLSLFKADLQGFFKRLRQSHVRGDDRRFKRSVLLRNGYSKRSKPLKYFAVGEYGGRTKRPHYHIILFNADLELMITPTMRKVLELSNYDGTKPMECKQWKKGHVTIGRISDASVGYTLKYINKDKKQRIPLFKGDLREPEFAVMSKGIGKSYLKESIIAWHKADLENRMYVNVAGGKKASMCRYYKDRLYSLEERLISARHQVKRLEDAARKKSRFVYDLRKDWLNKRAAINASIGRVIFNNLKTEKL